MKSITLATQSLFHFCTLVAGSRSNFNHIILSHLDELVGLPYIIRKVNMSSFHPNWNFIQNPPAALDMIQHVDKGSDWQI
jgi:hypothetical protein